ncbi:MAG: peptide-methionine (S)-S-oxide reductase MsrA [Clostridiales bacterium]|jgi:methionine-S-sulfoxide reductase|nr:peptide-methionine (S)-S-oxide reductase MsrA [Clostridiales bacterium]
MKKTIREIYLAGGCFWGLEKYMQNVSGVVETEAGYANGATREPSYEEVCGGSGHAETVRVMYDSTVSGLPFILRRYFDVIDPLSINRQGGDSGVQYRTGIYYTDKGDEPVIRAELEALSRECGQSIAVECLPLINYSPAEDYHQKYLDNNPGGYCHISLDEIEEVKQYRDIVL